MYQLLVLVVIGVASAGAQTHFQCPHDFGFYPHDVACDQYWACEANTATLKTCGNGLAFDDSDPEFLTQNCDYYHNVDCSTRPERQPAIPSLNCPYQYGIFSDEADCTVFWSCWGGEASRYQCGPGLAYHTKSRVCTWIDKVPECASQRAKTIQEFVCPAAGELVATSSFTRHAHPEDCREYYVCLDGIPRKYGCPIGTVFQIGQLDGHGQCADPQAVPGCEEYYGDLDLNALRLAQQQSGALGLGPGSQRIVPAPAPAAAPAARPSSRNRPQAQPEVALDQFPLN